MTPEELAADLNTGDLRDQTEKLKRIIESNESGTRKYAMIRIEAERFEKSVAPHAACRGVGCAHCCKQAVTITEREAMLIGEHIGRVPASLPDDDMEKAVARNKVDRAKYTDVPCPFLAEDLSCSIYTVRPTACITYHSLNNTPDDCKHDQVRTIVRVNPNNVLTATVVIDLKHGVGDIREYFP